MSIKFLNITKIFNEKELSRIKVLDNISFEIKEKSITGLIGKTGSGKTTISNILLGLDKPNNGEVIIDDILINFKSKRKDLKNINIYVLGNMQLPNHQLFKTTLREELLFPNNNIDVNEVVRNLNIDPLMLDKSPFKLSSGEKRKILLTTIINRNPKLIILDESTAFLDTQSRKELRQMIKKVNKEKGITFLFISHNMEDVIDLCEETILIDNGKLILKSNTKEVINKYMKGEYE